MVDNLKKIFSRIEMGLCWSEPPVAPVQRAYVVENPKSVATAPPYNPPSQYTYAVYPPQQQQYPQQQYPQQQQQYYYSQQVYPQQVYYQQQQQNRVSPAGAFVGGLVLGAVMEDIIDPE